jgi:hypothetical protein
MTDDLYRTYRKIFASSADERVACWYLGTMNAAVEGYPEIPLLRVATVMFYRTETLSPTRCKIHWDEVGEFIDHTTGQPAETWLNPVTGERVKCVPGFKEGGAHYTVDVAGPRLALALHQPGAHIDSVQVERKIDGDRVWINQTEKKTRSLHGPGAATAFTATTVLSFFGSLRDVADPARTWAPASGSYSFTMDGLMPWMGFGARKGRTIVRGVVHKAAPGVAIDAGADARLRNMYPTFFEGM